MRRVSDAAPAAVLTADVTADITTDFDGDDFPAADEDGSFVSEGLVSEGLVSETVFATDDAAEGDDASFGVEEF